MRQLRKRELLLEILNVELMALLGVIINIAGYAGLLLGGRTILHGIANSSLSGDNQYRRVCRVTARWAFDFAWYN